MNKNELEKIRLSLTEDEKDILRKFKDEKSIEMKDLIGDENQARVQRAVMWLSGKGLLNVTKTSFFQFVLDENGIEYSKKGLPEDQFLNQIKNERKSRQDLIRAGLNANEIGASIGVLKRKGLINVEKEGKDTFFSITPAGENYLENESLESKFIKSDFPKKEDSLSDEEIFAAKELLKRKQIIAKEEVKINDVEITDLGKEVLSLKNFDEILLNSLTSDIILSKKWENKKFRSFDVSANVPKVEIGRVHFENEAIRYMKNIFTDLGFSEMEGNFVDTAFEDLDVLFVPQDHPAREMQDTFYLKNPAKGQVDEKLFKKIKKVHEDGGNTGSKGWEYDFSKDISKKLLLRTHTTVLSAKYLKNLKKDDLPAKFFSVNKTFRNEALDWKHLFEFHQVEGIVVGKNLSLKHLMGTLKEFFGKMGYTDVRMRPAYFPYTEPSMEVDVFHPVKKEWIELGGSGIFRPEVVRPLLEDEFGEEADDITVLAFGLGMERIIVNYFGFNDLRDLHKNDLKQTKFIKKFSLYR